MSSFGLRLKLDLSDIHPSIDNPIQWLFVDLNHLKIASDIARHLRNSYFQDRNLKETEVELFLGDGLIPPNTSLKIFKSDELVKVKVKKKKIEEICELFEDPEVPVCSRNPLDQSLSHSRIDSSSTSSSSPLERVIKAARAKEDNKLVEAAASSGTFSRESLFAVSANEKLLALAAQKKLEKTAEESSLSSTALSLSQLQQDSLTSPPLELSTQDTDVSMAFINQAQIQFLQQTRRKCGRYGNDWMARTTIKDDKLMYECGTPDSFWIFAWTDGLEDMNEYIQVRYLRLK